MAGLKVVQHLDHRHGAGARGGHGALAAHDVVTVDHAAMLMSADGDSAADVADDEVAVLIGTAEGGRVADGHLLEVERMQVHVAVHAVDAGHPGGPAELVGVGRVDHKGAAAVGLGKAAGQRGAKVCRVRHAVGAADGVLEDEVGNLVDAALHGQRPPPRPTKASTSERSTPSSARMSEMAWARNGSCSASVEKRASSSEL